MYDIPRDTEGWISIFTPTFVKQFLKAIILKSQQKYNPIYWTLQSAYDGMVRARGGVIVKEHVWRNMGWMRYTLHMVWWDAHG